MAVSELEAQPVSFYAAVFFLVNANRFLFRSLLGCMRAKETDLLDVGCRTLAAALGKHHATIARLLPRLVQVSDGIITKVADARRRSADVHLFQLPVM
jgi:hypothetical protein